MKKRRTWLLIFAVLALSVMGYLVSQKELLLARGEIILLKLAPVDPRSLIQGDYMRLEYEITDFLEREQQQRISEYERSQQVSLSALEDFKTSELDPIYYAHEGYIVIRLDKNKVASFVRFHDGKTQIAAGELLLKFRRFFLPYRSRINIGPKSFFFQEGMEPFYRKARYGELVVSKDGDVILVGLRDENLKIIKPTRQEVEERNIVWP